MILRPVRRDCRRILLDVPNLPSGKQWDGKRFTPSTGIAWLSERLDPISAAPLSVGAYGETEENFVYRIDLIYPIDGAASDADDVADAIRDAFHPGRLIGSPSPVPMWGTVRKSERRRPVAGPIWYEVPVRIEFYIRRPTRLAA